VRGREAGFEAGWRQLTGPQRKRSPSKRRQSALPLRWDQEGAEPVAEW
jgi:hypothetical protein